MTLDCEGFFHFVNSELVRATSHTTVALLVIVGGEKNLKNVGAGGWEGIAYLYARGGMQLEKKRSCTSSDPPLSELLSAFLFVRGTSAPGGVRSPMTLLRISSG